MREFVGELDGVEKVHPKMVFDPPWSPEMMTEDAKFDEEAMRGSEDEATRVREEVTSPGETASVERYEVALLSVEQAGQVWTRLRPLEDRGAGKPIQDFTRAECRLRGSGIAAS